MARNQLEGLRVAVLTADGFELVEVTRPVRALEKHGAEVDIVALRAGTIQGMKLLAPGEELRVDRTVAAADPDDYDALLIPGGFIGPDFVRQNEGALEFVRAFDAGRKPIATIGHGPWVLISAGLMNGRRLTSWPGIRDDVLNAGGEWVDEAAVNDDNWLSSRGPQDLRAFDRAVIEHFASLETRAGRGGLARMGFGSLLVGAAAAAAAGLAMRRTRGTRQATGDGQFSDDETASRMPDLEEMEEEPTGF